MGWQSKRLHFWTQSKLWPFWLFKTSLFSIVDYWEAIPWLSCWKKVAKWSGTRTSCCTWPKILDSDCCLHLTPAVACLILEWENCTHVHALHIQYEWSKIIIGMEICPSSSLFGHAIVLFRALISLFRALILLFWISFESAFLNVAVLCWSLP